MALTHEDGYLGLFTREQSEGAIPNGSRIRKMNTGPGDAHPDGSLGIILGSVRLPPDLEASAGSLYVYFVEWQASPKVAIGVVGRKIRPDGETGQ